MIRNGRSRTTNRLETTSMVVGSSGVASRIPKRTANGRHKTNRNKDFGKDCIQKQTQLECYFIQQRFDNY